MRTNEAVRLWDNTRKTARQVPTWRLKLWTYVVRRRLESHKSEVNQLRLVALQDELNHR